MVWPWSRTLPQWEDDLYSNSDLDSILIGVGYIPRSVSILFLPWFAIYKGSQLFPVGCRHSHPSHPISFWMHAQTPITCAAAYPHPWLLTHLLYHCSINNHTIYPTDLVHPNLLTFAVFFTTGWRIALLAPTPMDHISTWFRLSLSVILVWGAWENYYHVHLQTVVGAPSLCPTRLFDGLLIGSSLLLLLHWFF